MTVSFQISSLWWSTQNIGSWGPLLTGFPWFLASMMAFCSSLVVDPTTSSHSNMFLDNSQSLITPRQQENGNSPKNTASTQKRSATAFGSSFTRLILLAKSMMDVAHAKQLPCQSLLEGWPGSHLSSSPRIPTTLLPRHSPVQSNPVLTWRGRSFLFRWGVVVASAWSHTIVFLALTQLSWW